MQVSKDNRPIRSCGIGKKIKQVKDAIDETKKRVEDIKDVVTTGEVKDEITRRIEKETKKTILESGKGTLGLSKGEKMKKGISDWAMSGTQNQSYAGQIDPNSKQQKAVREAYRLGYLKAKEKQRAGQKLKWYEKNLIESTERVEKPTPDYMKTEEQKLSEANERMQATAEKLKPLIERLRLQTERAKMLGTEHYESAKEYMHLDEDKIKYLTDINRQAIYLRLISLQVWNKQFNPEWVQTVSWEGKDWTIDELADNYEVLDAITFSDDYMKDIIEYNGKIFEARLTGEPKDLAGMKTFWEVQIEEMKKWADWHDEQETGSNNIDDNHKKKDEASVSDKELEGLVNESFGDLERQMIEENEVVDEHWKNVQEIIGANRQEEFQAFYDQYEKDGKFPNNADSKMIKASLITKEFFEKIAKERLDREERRVNGYYDYITKNLDPKTDSDN